MIRRFKNFLFGNLSGVSTEFYNGTGAFSTPVGTGAGADKTYLTEDDETGTLPNSRQLLAGTNITFDDTVAGERTVNASSGSGGGAESGTYASLPAAGTAGRIYMPTDSPIILRDDGAAWETWVNSPLYKCTPPVDGDYSWVNQGGASKDATKGFVRLVAPATAGLSARIRTKAQPSTPYTITACFIRNGFHIDFGSCGIGFRNSGSGKLHTASLMGVSGTGRLQSRLWSGPTAVTVDYNGDYWYPGNGPVWLRIINDGTTNRSTWISSDGQNFIRQTNIAFNDSFTPDEVFFYVDAGQAFYDVQMDLLSWVET